MKKGQSEQDGQGGFARRAAWLTTANSIAFGLSFIAPLLLVRTLSQTDFGVYKQVFQILMSTTAALTIGAALAFHNVRAMIWASAIQGLLQILFMFAYIRRRFGQSFWRTRGLFDWALFKTQIGNALPYGLGSFAQTTQGDLHNF